MIDRGYHFDTTQHEIQLIGEVLRITNKFGDRRTHTISGHDFKTFYRDLRDAMSMQGADHAG